MKARLIALPISCITASVSRAEAAVAQLVKDVTPGVADSDPNAFAAIRNKLFFAADDGVSGHEAWLMSANNLSQVELVDLDAGDVDSTPVKFVEHRDQVLTFSWDGVFSCPLHGTSANATLIAKTRTNFPHSLKACSPRTAFKPLA